VWTATLEQIPGVQDLVIGATLGAAAGRLVVARRERRAGELTAAEVRITEIRWMWVGLVFGIAAYILGRIL
jgi:hypothetical protein